MIHQLTLITPTSYDCNHHGWFINSHSSHPQATTAIIMDDSSTHTNHIHKLRLQSSWMIHQHIFVTPTSNDITLLGWSDYSSISMIIGSNKLWCTCISSLSFLDNRFHCVRVSAVSGLLFFFICRLFAFLCRHQWFVGWIHASRIAIFTIFRSKYLFSYFALKFVVLA